MDYDDYLIISSVQYSCAQFWHIDVGASAILQTYTIPPLLALKLPPLI